jgi:hypothetical protein
MTKNIDELTKMAGKLYEEDGKPLYRPKRIEKVKFDMDPELNRYFNCNLNQDLLLRRMLISRSFVDFTLWEVLKTNLSLLTGLSYIKQSEVVKATGISKGKISESLKRLKTPIPLENWL